MCDVRPNIRISTSIQIYKKKLDKLTIVDCYYLVSIKFLITTAVKSKVNLLDGGDG